MEAITALLLLLVYGVTSFQLTIDPPSLVVKDRGNVTVMCQSEQELADCQFNWWDLDDDLTPILKFDFHQGSDSDTAYLVNGSEVNWRLAGYRYVGEGLRAGQCGIQLFGLKDVRYRMLSCRARQLGTGWKYAYMTITGNVTTELGFTPSEQTAVVVPGDQLRVLSSAPSGTRIRSCKFRLTGKDPICFGDPKPRNATGGGGGGNNNNPRRGGVSGPNRRRPDAATRVVIPCTPGSRTSSNGPWTYNGVSSSQCGIIITNVTEELNGLVFFEAWTEPGGYDRRVFHLTVADPPTKCNMDAPKSSLLENEVFHVTCTVNKSRPLANITWYMGDEVLRQDSLDDSSPENHNDSPWRWAHESYSLSQTMVLRAKREWNGLQIKCVVSHQGLPNGRIVLAQVLSVAGSSGISETCPAVPPSSGVLQECMYGNRAVDCSGPMQFGTVLKMTPQCRDGTPPTQISLTCLRTGTWDKTPVRCKPGCGTVRAGVQTPPKSDHSLVQGQLPWQVAIYQLKQGNYEQVCSGSLLSMTSILTAANCFVDDMWGAKSFNGSLYKVAAAKLNRKWEIRDDYVQIRSVASLSVPMYYSGESGSFNFNLAVLKVTEPFQYTENVSPVCVNLNVTITNQHQFLMRKTGYVAGWGFTEEDSPGTALKSVALPYVGYDECRNSLQPAARRYLTGYSFCAGTTHHLHGYTVCESDRGAGLAMLDPSTGRYNVVGVASVAFKPLANTETCYPSSLLNFATFSGIPDWIRENTS